MNGLTMNWWINFSQVILIHDFDVPSGKNNSGRKEPLGEEKNSAKAGKRE